MEARFIELAGEVNTGMLEKVVNGMAEALQKAGKQITGSQVMLLGLAYKGDVDADAGPRRSYRYPLHCVE
jgi:UDP-N-acetyl-D-glucosamine dehydrogenase